MRGDELLFVETLEDVIGNDQFNYILGAYEKSISKQNLVGMVEYKSFQDVIYIDMITVHKNFKRMGIGLAMIEELIRIYNYENIRWSLTTDEGEFLRKAIVRKYE